MLVKCSDKILAVYGTKARHPCRLWVTKGGGGVKSTSQEQRFAAPISPPGAPLVHVQISPPMSDAALANTDQVLIVAPKLGW